MASTWVNYWPGGSLHHAACSGPLAGASRPSQAPEPCCLLPSPWPCGPVLFHPPGGPCVHLPLQSFTAGVGNWVADECLYQARIHPEQPAASLTAQQVRLGQLEWCGGAAGC